MRLMPSAALVLLCAACLHAEEAVRTESPAGQLRLAVQDLATKVEPADAPYVRYLSFATVPAELRNEFRIVFRFWFNHTNSSRNPFREIEIDPGDPRQGPPRPATLVRIDIRDAINWTRAAWVLVADRDYLFRQPLLPARETNFMRLVMGIEANPKTLAAGGILNAYQLFRDSIEADRVQTYYDLLYAAERHPDPKGQDQFVEAPKAVDPGPEPQKPVAKPWKGGIWPADGKFYKAGEFEWVPQAELDQWEKAHKAWEKAKAASATPSQRGDAAPSIAPKTGQILPARLIGIKDAGKGDANFPKTGEDFERRWGVDFNETDLKELRVDPRVGGIAPGRDSDSKAGSFVANHDRGIRIRPSKIKAGGFGARTYDFFRNVGDQDIIEQFREFAVKRELKAIRFDGGELLATIPNGAQAHLLVNGQDARVEKADPDLASIRGKTDDRFPTVKTSMGCIACHTPSDGFIAFTEQLRDSIRKGIKANILSADEAKLAEDFYLSWDEDVAAFRMPYAAYLRRTTVTDGGKAWTGEQAWTALKLARDRYDRPVTLETAAFEFGVPVETLRKQLLGKSENDSPKEIRLNQLVIGKSIPRQTWQEDVAFKMMVFLEASKPGTPVILDEKQLAEAYKKFGVKP